MSCIYFCLLKIDYIVYIVSRNPESIDKAGKRERLWNYNQMEKSMCETFLLVTNFNPSKNGSSRRSQVSCISIACDHQAHPATEYAV